LNIVRVTKTPVPSKVFYLNDPILIDWRVNFLSGEKTVGVKPVFKKVLTDVDRGIYVESWEVSNEDFGLDGRWCIKKCRLRGGTSEGVDIITVDNGALSFTVIPTRGMGIWKGEFKGLPLGWESPVKSPVHPHYINLEARGGLGWLDGFNEWVVRCGLGSLGAPGIDTIIDNMGRRREVMLTLHGRIANIPASEVKCRVYLEPSVKLSVEGVVYERSMFGPNLKMTTEISTTPNSNTLKITDRIENLKSTPDEMQILYHCNYGVPLLEDGARLVAPFHKVAPRDERAAEGIESFDEFGPPESGFVEQVYFCKLVGDGRGYTKAALLNRDRTRAASISFSLSELPYFTVWKNTNSLEEGYVMGLEPGTSFPNHKSFERRMGRVVNLKPGETYEVTLELSAHVGAEEVRRLEDEIEGLMEGVETEIFRNPVEGFSPT